MLKEFFAYYRPHRALFLVDFGCAVLSGLLELGFPMAVKAFVDLLLPRGDWPLIMLAGLALLVVYAVNSGLMAIVTYWGHRLGINIETEMRRRAFDHLQKLSFRFYDEQKTGHLVARVTKDLEEIGEVAHHGPEDLFIAIMTFIGAFLLMLYVHPQLALITALIVPLAGFIVARYGALMAQNWRLQFGRVGAFNARLEENIGGMRVVQAFANEAHERALFAGDNQRYRTTKLEAYRIMAASQAVNYLGMRMVQLAVMLAGTYYVVQGSLSVGGFVGFLLLVGVFYRPLDKIAGVIETYPKGIAGFQRYQELLATEPDIADAADAIDAPPLKGDIRFEGVGFGYASERPVLSGIALSVAAGETVAFVGPSGAGKTTLLSLLPRFYEVDAGRITVDGHDIRALTLASLRRQIGIVGPAGCLPLRRHHPREHRLWPPRCERRRDHGGRPPRAARDDDRGPAGRARHGDRRARRQALRRPEAAPRHRPHLPEKSADPDPRRGNLGARHRDGSRDPAIPDRTLRGTHDAGHRPSPRHDPPCRPHRRGDAGRHRRAGPP
ncbi:ATP-binding cassette subfamily B protein [Bosea sp. OAE506]